MYVGFLFDHRGCVCPNCTKLPVSSSNVQLASTMRVTCLQNEMLSLGEAGYSEVTLLGQNVDAYGRDLPGFAQDGALLRQNFHALFCTAVQSHTWQF
jgi:hypothetical protein